MANNNSQRKTPRNVVVKFHRDFIIPTKQNREDALGSFPFKANDPRANIASFNNSRRKLLVFEQQENDDDDEEEEKQYPKQRHQQPKKRPPSVVKNNTSTEKAFHDLNIKELFVPTSHSITTFSIPKPKNECDWLVQNPEPGQTFDEYVLSLVTRSGRIKPIANASGQQIVLLPIICSDETNETPSWQWWSRNNFGQLLTEYTRAFFDRDVYFLPPASITQSLSASAPSKTKRKEKVTPIKCLASTTARTEKVKFLLKFPTETEVTTEDIGSIINDNGNRSDDISNEEMNHIESQHEETMTGKVREAKDDLKNTSFVHQKRPRQHSKKCKTTIISGRYHSGTNRFQLEVESILNAIASFQNENNHNNIGIVHNSFCIMGITMEDLYNGSPTDLFCGGMAYYGSSKVAVLSFHRYHTHLKMSPQYWFDYGYSSVPDTYSYYEDDDKKDNKAKKSKRLKMVQVDLLSQPPPPLANVTLTSKTNTKKKSILINNDNDKNNHHQKPNNRKGMLISDVESTVSVSDPTTAGEIVVDAEFLRRCCKLLTHELGHLYGIAHCIHNKCLMMGTGHLVEDFAAPTNLCSICLRKLQWRLGFDVLGRYQLLKESLQKMGLQKEEDWCQKQIDKIISNSG